MPHARRILLGSAASLLTVVSAQAADLPTRKAAPVEYVRICSVYGPGFFYIPGSDTCLKIGGHVRAEYARLQAYSKGSDETNFRMETRISLDARTQTDLGTLRAYFAIDFRRNTGNGWFGSGTSVRAAQAFQFVGPPGTFPSFAGIDTVDHHVDLAFVDSAPHEVRTLPPGAEPTPFDTTTKPDSGLKPDSIPHGR